MFKLLVIVLIIGEGLSLPSLLRKNEIDEEEYDAATAKELHALFKALFHHFPSQFIDFINSLNRSEIEVLMQKFQSEEFQRRFEGFDKLPIEDACVKALNIIREVAPDTADQLIELYEYTKNAISGLKTYEASQYFIQFEDRSKNFIEKYGAEAKDHAKEFILSEIELIEYLPRRSLDDLAEGFPVIAEFFKDPLVLPSVKRFITIMPY